MNWNAWSISSFTLISSLGSPPPAGPRKLLILGREKVERSHDESNSPEFGDGKMDNDRFIPALLLVGSGAVPILIGVIYSIAYGMQIEGYVSIPILGYIGALWFLISPFLLLFAWLVAGRFDENHESEKKLIRLSALMFFSLLVFSIFLFILNFHVH